MESNKIIEEVKSGDEKVLKKLYAQIRPKFLNWTVQNHQIEHEDALDIYQKTFTTFYFNIKDGKLTELTSSLETYFFGIGKMMIKERFRDRNFKLQTIDEKEALEKIDMNMVDDYQNSEHKEIVSELLDKVGEPCKSVLMMYYFQKFAMESIATVLGYKNERVAKKKKYQCLGKLRELMTDAPEMSFGAA